MLGKFPMDKISKDAVAGYMTILESEAGIMPRTIHHIFQGLQRQVKFGEIFHMGSIDFVLVRRLHSENHVFRIVQ